MGIISNHLLFCQNYIYVLIVKDTQSAVTLNLKLGLKRKEAINNDL